MEVRDDYWGVIVNPHSGKKNLHKDRVEIFRLIKKAEIQFFEQTTEYAGHAIEIARNLVEKGFVNILVIGGDGTLNEVVNGVYTSNIENKSDISISVIPYGTGNDWARYWGFLDKNKKLSQKLFERRKIKVDIGCVTYVVDKQEYTYYFLNAAGFGFDGQVVKVTNFLKRFLGGNSWTYSLAIISAVFMYKPTKMLLEGLDKSFEGKIFTVALGNSCYSGGGIKQTPKAIPTDGLFHITAIENPTFIKIITGLKALFTGNFDNHPCAHNFVTKTFKIKIDKPLIFETDGVLLPASKDIKVDVLPNALGMYI